MQITLMGREALHHSDTANNTRGSGSGSTRGGGNTAVVGCAVVVDCGRISQQARMNTDNPLRVLQKQRQTLLSGGGMYDRGGWYI